MKKLLLLFIAAMPTAMAGAQGVAINTSGTTANSSAILDVSSTTQGMLVPRMDSLTRISISSPAQGLLVYQKNGTTAGFYYYTGSVWQSLNSATAWSTKGNTPGATAQFGTLDNNNVDLYTNNIVRGRLSNLGEFFIGATGTSAVGDLMGAVGNNTFPYALNGYSSFNGSGVYGAITAGTTQSGAVQGENNSPSTSSFSAPGVRGSYNGGSTGTGFRTLSATGPEAGVIGNESKTTGSYMFGVHGSFSSTSIRCGGVYGDDLGLAAGALGYYASTGVDYGVYGFGNAYQAGATAGRMSGGVSHTTSIGQTTQIGMGIYGGVMGGWVNGCIYGMHVKGDRYSLYVDGKQYTNEPIVQLVTNDDGNRTPTYVPSAATADVYARGKAILVGGSVYVPFTDAYKQIISDPAELSVTVTPRGQTHGLYVASIDANGFWVKENEPGVSNAAFDWMAAGTRKGSEHPETSAEILTSSFDDDIRGIMKNENDLTNNNKHLWWDGGNIRTDAPPARETDPSYNSGVRVQQQSAPAGVQGKDQIRQ